MLRCPGAWANSLEVLSLGVALNIHAEESSGIIGVTVGVQEPATWWAILYYRWMTLNTAFCGGTRSTQQPAFAISQMAIREPRWYVLIA